MRRIGVCFFAFLLLASHLFASGNTKNKVRIGYYSGDQNFQKGFSDSERKSGYAYEYYQKIAAITAWKYEYIYGSRAEVIEKLIAGEIDIVAGIYETEKYRSDILFSKHDMGLEGNPRYFVVNKDRTDILSELDNAISLILSTTPDYPILLRQKYFSQTMHQALTKSEREWLSQFDSLKIGYVKNNLPISDQNDLGNPDGVAMDVFMDLYMFLQITIEPVCYESVPLMEAGLKNGEIDAAFPVFSELWFNEQKGFVLTDSFISDRVMIAYKGRYRHNLMDTVAIVENGLGQRYYLSIYYPNSEVKFYDSREHAFTAIEEGEANCILGCSSILQRFMSGNPKWKNMNIAYLNLAEDFGIAVKHGDIELVGILNKAIKHIDTASITSSMIKHSSIEPNFTIANYIRNHYIAFMIVLLTLLGIMLLTFLKFRHQTKLFNAEQEGTRHALEDALNAANAANRAKSTFLSNMSHDIRTPMNGIMGMAAIAEANIDDKQRVQDCLLKINSSGKHLLGLINEVLDMSKIESGEMNLTENDFTVSSVIDDLKTINLPLINEKKQSFEIHTSNIINEHIIGDSVRLQQVLTNLISNAIKYTPEGGKIDVTITEKSSGKPNLSCFEFVVRDNGIGMSEEFLPKLFEPFTRADNTMTNQIQGTGLGMAITRNIIRMMDGDITVKSKLGEGTSFTVVMFFKLPNKITKPEDKSQEPEDKSQEEEKIDEELPKAEPTLKGISEALNKKNCHVLLAEDNEINAEIAIEVLKMAGVSTVWAQNGLIAVEKFNESKSGEYDCIFMDIQMPVMTGIEASKTIRNSPHPDAKKIPIFAVTANAFAEDVQAVLNAGMNEHISKPLDFHALVRLMNKYIE